MSVFVCWGSGWLGSDWPDLLTVDRLISQLNKHGGKNNIWTTPRTRGEGQGVIGEKTKRTYIISVRIS